MSIIMLQNIKTVKLVAVGTYDLKWIDFKRTFIILIPHFYSLRQDQTMQSLHKEFSVYHVFIQLALLIIVHS